MFGEWINEQLQERGWSQRELARRAKIAHTNVADVISGRRPPTWDFCAAIAMPLAVSPIEIFQRAGLLTGMSASRGQTEYYAATMTSDEMALLEYYRAMTAEAQKYALATVAGIKNFDRGYQP